MSVGISPQCFACVRLRGVVPGVGWSCEAFGDKPIPKDILVNAVDHREPYQGDHGLRFAEKGALDLILARIDAAEFKESEHLRDESGKFAEGGTAKSPEYDPSDPAVRDIKTSLPVLQGKELIKIYHVANREADKRGELGRKANTYPVEKVPIDQIVATQPGLNSTIVKKYEDEPPSGEKPEALYYQGKFYLREGHHRVEAAKRRGETHIEAHVNTVGKRKQEKRADDSILRAAGVMFQAPDGAILMLRRTDPAHPGAWAFPGGGIEDGETAEEAARREAIEEVGPHYYGDLEPWTRRIRDGVDFTTFRQRVPERFDPVLNHEHDAFEWVIKDEQVSKASAHYTDQSTDTEQCSGCSMFRAPDKCTLVEGVISPGGWCKHYEPAG